MNFVFFSRWSISETAPRSSADAGLSWQKGERPIGAATGKQSQPPRPCVPPDPPPKTAVGYPPPPSLPQPGVLTASWALIRPPGEDAMGRSCILDPPPPRQGDARSSAHAGLS